MKTTTRPFAVVKTVNNTSFWKKLKEVKLSFKAVVDAQAISESATCTLKDVVLGLEQIYTSFACGRAVSKISKLC